MTLDWRNPAHPVSRPASPVRCRGCGVPFQAGHVPVGDPLCAECDQWAAEGLVAVPLALDLPDSRPGGGAGLI